MAKFGKGKTKLSPVGLVLEKHSTAKGKRFTLRCTESTLCSERFLSAVL